ncbi:hypothetical protein [Parasitella parasitica]|uniref:Uncharacterized protein n=1 Tax=Parasitella parasitica TaxID=35722 RepID=A0A0B7NK27_9FUNG|nr:hypothetical protein [Parasitella parasitica]
MNIKKQRLDVLMYLLWDVVLPDMMQDHIRTTSGVQQRRLNNAERSRIENAMSFNDIEAEALVSAQGSSVEVLSFTTDGKTYEIDVDLRKIESAFDPHRQRNLSMYGRATIASVLVFTKLWHILRITILPKAFL